MSIKKIMVPFSEAATGKRAFAAGAVFAKEFKAHLDVVHVRHSLSPSVPGNVYYPIAVTYVEENLEALTETANRLAADLEKEFKTLCGKQSIDILETTVHTDDKGATASWTDVTKDMPYSLATRARVSDLTILSRPGDNDPKYLMADLEETIFQSGQPVLIVSESQSFDQFPKTVFVAWDGGREAARALSAALPILQRAELVVVTSVGKMDWGVEPPENVVAFLKLHGVHAEYIHPSLEKGESIEDIFQHRAQDKNADLIVMGAYSHSRWREMVLGGFTRTMLKTSNIPLLMAH